MLLLLSRFIDLIDADADLVADADLLARVADSR
jgi:hypothetical protein